MESTDDGPDLAKLRQAQRLIAEAFGGASDEASKNSADRFARWQKSAFWDVQQAYSREDLKLFDVPAENAVGLVTIKVTAYSSCEHHFAPAWLKATVGYVPDKSFVGYSKIVRMFKSFASRYTMDERICNEFLAEFNAVAVPLGAGVVMRGKHFCVISRGGPETDFPMMSAFTGSLRTDKDLQREFQDYARTSWADGV